MLFVDTCTPWELSRGVNGLWIAPIERCFQCELRVPAEMWMGSDLFRLKMVDGEQVKLCFLHLFPAFILVLSEGQSATAVWQVEIDLLS